MNNTLKTILALPRFSHWQRASVQAGQYITMAIMTATTAPYTTAIGATIISFTIPAAPVGPLFQTMVITSGVAPLRASTPSIKPIWDPTQAILTNLVIADASNAGGSRPTEAGRWPLGEHSRDVRQVHSDGVMGGGSCVLAQTKAAHECADVARLSWSDFV